MTKTIVPRWLLLQFIEIWKSVPLDRCMTCGKRCPELLATDNITFTRDDHSEVDAANVEMRLCPECRDKALSHPSCIIMTQKGGDV